ncbi:GH23367 [Drosophila grimshawi]|uniref:GH23367 n=1 Tax=Drosophila grimshawi TaxID=7222 RepID=B4JT18_DROGR|nr:GH23367 [Drosophila grimshawi]
MKVTATLVKTLTGSDFDSDLDSDTDTDTDAEQRWPTGLERVKESVSIAASAI